MGRIRDEEEIAARKAKKERNKALKQAARESASVTANPQGVKKKVKKGAQQRPPGARGPQLPELPFRANPDDHCETAPQAFCDVAPLLRLLATRLGKRPEELSIYDPYFCSGASKRHLAALGFPNVHNACEDFYAVQREGRIPRHDVVVTNPPYSEDPDGGKNHVAKLLHFLARDRKPFLLNMPEYVASTGYYKRRFAQPGRARYPKRGAPPLLLCPRKRYHFWSPHGARPDHEKKNPSTHSDAVLGIRSSPFVALWYIDIGPIVEREELLELAASGALEGICRPHEGSGCLLCRDLEELPKERALFKALGE
eukprot:TRINITY_DN32283_c0_g1_i1.p1 TRINITY_DN32283_c0_g1~~TRINITY_DN32283_c0_g1_i1.p1  ORF type:complete len:312 (+),score=59.48 TRINITY_DN32283_c0_g1_i1:57-992(+)